MAILSIIVPVFNSEIYLESCIDSILAQTFADFELILVDDKSKDASGIICDTYRERDSRIRVIHHDKNLGLSKSREDGFLLSEGKWIAFVDNDDLLAPDMYKQLMSHVNENVDVACVRGEDRKCSEMKQPVWPQHIAKAFTLTGKEACEVIYSQTLDFGGVGPMWGKIFRRSLVVEGLRETECYKEQLNWVYFEDVLYMPLLWNKVNKVAFDDILMYMHRRVGTNLSSSMKPQPFHYQAVEASLLVSDFLEKQGMYQAAAVHLLGSIIGMQSTWYKVQRFEKDEEKKKRYDIYVDEKIEKYKIRLYEANYKDKKSHFLKNTIKLFEKNKIAWKVLVGGPYFSIIRGL